MAELDPHPPLFHPPGSERYPRLRGNEEYQWLSSEIWSKGERRSPKHMPWFIPDFPAGRDHLLCWRSEAGIVRMFALQARRNHVNAREATKGVCARPSTFTDSTHLSPIPDSPDALFAQHVWLTVALSWANLLECQVPASSHAVWSGVRHDQRDVYRH